MAALVKGFCSDCRFYSHSCVTLLRAGNVILMCRLCVSRFLSTLSKAKCCIIISLAICFSVITLLHQRHSVNTAAHWTSPL